MKKYERLEEKPIPGKTYMNAGSQYVIKSVCFDTAIVMRVKDGYVCVAHNPALYLVDDDHVELQWDYSTGGRFI